MRGDLRLLVSFLPGEWHELATSTGALAGLRKDKSAENLLRVLLIHLGCGHSLRETAVRSRKTRLAGPHRSHRGCGCAGQGTGCGRCASSYSGIGASNRPREGACKCAIDAPTVK